MHWPVGVTLELDLHSVGPGTSKTHPGILLGFLPMAISSGVCCNQLRVPAGGQCVGSLWLRRFVSLTFLLERIPCFSSRERPLCSVSHSILVPRAWHRNPHSCLSVRSPLQHTLLVTPGSLLMRAFGEPPVCIQWTMILRESVLE